MRLGKIGPESVKNVHTYAILKIPRQFNTPKKILLNGYKFSLL